MYISFGTLEYHRQLKILIKPIKSSRCKGLFKILFEVKDVYALDV